MKTEEKYRSILDELIKEIKYDDEHFGNHSDKVLCQSVFAQLNNANLYATFESIEPKDYSDGELIDIATSCLRLVYRKRLASETT